MTCSKCGSPRERAKHSYCRVCSNAYMRSWNRGEIVKAERPAVCSVESCSRRVHAVGMCRPHRDRFRRTGVAEKTARTLHPKRYKLSVSHGHQLAHANTGRVYVHRMVLFDLIGLGNFACFWCGITVRWSTAHPQPHDALIVDHVDHDRHNNDPTNLVPSCGRCNSARSRWRVLPPLVSVYSLGGVSA